MFVGNYYNEDQADKVTYTHPESGEAISIPYSQDEMLWPALYSILTPVCLNISDGLNILHCTSDILDVAGVNGHLEITLFGDRDLAGEIVFEGATIHQIKYATLNGEDMKMIRDEKRIAFNYSHQHKKELKVNIIFDEY